jgi:hypothetical protein
MFKMRGITGAGGGVSSEKKSKTFGAYGKNHHEMK